MKKSKLSGKCEGAGRETSVSGTIHGPVLTGLTASDGLGAGQYGQICGVEGERWMEQFNAI